AGFALQQVTDVRFILLPRLRRLRRVGLQFIQRNDVILVLSCDPRRSRRKAERECQPQGPHSDMPAYIHSDSPIVITDSALDPVSPSPIRLHEREDRFPEKHKYAGIILKVQSE